MKSTGEQFIPGISSKRLSEEHFERYKFSLKYCKGKKVLDIACGTGYGSHEIAQVAESVTGVDISEESIRHARDHYFSKNLEFKTGDCAEMHFQEDFFDVIISFETIEHLTERQLKKYIENCKYYLRGNGLMIISTPNKKITSPFSEKPLNKFHIHEFTKKELEDFFSGYFKNFEFYGQRFVLKILTTYFLRKFIRLIEILLLNDLKFYSERPSPEVKKWTQKNKEPRIILLKMKL